MDIHFPPASPTYLPPERLNGWVTLDRSWARELGVPRDRGAYRIRRRELLRRLSAVPSTRPAASVRLSRPAA